jgi:hypothetical protein
MDLSFLNPIGGPRVVIGVVVALITILVLRRLMQAGKVESNLNQRKTCGKCGWEGTVSKHKPKCPKCANPL